MQETDAAELARVRGPRDRHDDRDLRARQPRQGRGRPGRPEREPRARPRRDRRPSVDGSARCERHRCAGASSPAACTAASARRGTTSRSCARPLPRPVRRCSRRTACRRRPSSSPSEHLELAQPQAVVINSGNANAATGEQGMLDAGRPRPRPRGCSGSSRGGARALDRRDRRAAAGRARCCAASAHAVAALSPDGGADAAEAILTTDTRAKEAVAHGDGFAVGGMAKGSGMIHPQSRDDARRRHDRLSARAGRGDRVPAPRRRRELQLDLRRRRVLDERRGRAARERRERASDAATTRAFAEALRTVCAELARPDRRRRRRRDAWSREIGVSGAATDRRGEGDRAARSRRRRSSRPRCSARTRTGDASLAAAGSAPYNGGYAQLDPTP